MKTKEYHLQKISEYTKKLQTNEERIIAEWQTLSSSQMRRLEIGIKNFKKLIDFHKKQL